MQELVLIQPGRTAETNLQRDAAEAVLRREFEVRLAACGPLAFRVARGVLRNTADAEDVAQDAILRAYRRFDKLRDRSRFRAWLVRITFRLALDRAKSSNRRQQRETLWVGWPSIS
jgi:DNA-directed RNA polymerase specialized sigma24 family protein